MQRDPMTAKRGRSVVLFSSRQYNVAHAAPETRRVAEKRLPPVDEIVFRAMAKWPKVPVVFGWLSLDRRGRWRLRGEPLTHAATLRFINRNYAGDERGRWYFQNGPQRVFVSLDYTPFVLSLDGYARLHTHTGSPVRSLRAAALDDEGNLLLLCEHGPGVLDDRDLLAASEGFTDARGRRCPDDLLETVLNDPTGRSRARLSFRWQDMCAPLETLIRAEVPRRFGFVTTPGPED